jgi:hypothetical protein
MRIPGHQNTASTKPSCRTGTSGRKMIWHDLWYDYRIPEAGRAASLGLEAHDVDSGVSTLTMHCVPGALFGTQCACKNKEWVVSMTKDCRLHWESGTAKRALRKMCDLKSPYPMLPKTIGRSSSSGWSRSKTAGSRNEDDGACVCGFPRA